MDSKGCSLPAMLEPANPFSMKQPPESLSGRKGRGDMGDDPGHLMDKAAAQLAATLQDSVLQKMANNHNNHGHERLKDLTSRVLNGDQDKMPKLCAPEPPALKSTEAPSSHGSPHQRKGASPSSPELKLKITKMVKQQQQQQQQQPRFEPCCAEGHSLATAAEAILSASNQGKEVRKRKGRPCKPKHKPRLKLASSTIPGVVPSFLMTAPEDQTGTAEKQAYPLSEVEEAPPLQPTLSFPEVQLEPPLQACPSLPEVQLEPPLQASSSPPEVQVECPLQASLSLPEVQLGPPLQASLSHPEVQVERPVQPSLSLPEVQMEPPLQASPSLPEVVQGSREEPRPQIGYSVGDVVWTKVSGYPWWPCVVTTDPELNKHVKQKQKAANGRPLGLLYHVQYFGDAPERGYVFERSMVAFHGEEQYHQLGRHRNKQPASRVLNKKAAPSVPRKLRTQWNIGVRQAEEAVSMALEERMATFTFAYDQDGPHLNPLVLEKLMPAQTRPAEKGEEPKKTKEEEEEEEKQAHDRSRLNPVLPTQNVTAAMSTTSPPPRDRSTSKGRKTPAPKKPRIKPVKQRKLPVSLLKRKGMSAKTKNPSKEKPQAESTSEEPSTLLAEAESKVLEPQKRKRKPSLKYQPALKTVRRTKSKPDPPPVSDVLETVTHVPSAPAKPKNPRKKMTDLGVDESKTTAFTQIKRRERKKSAKRSPAQTVETEPQPKKRRRATKGVENKQFEVTLLKATVTGDTTTKKLRNRKTKEVNEIKKKRVKIWTVSPTDVKVPEKPKRIRKRKQELGNQLAMSQAKKRRTSLCPEPEGSGSEGRPESPSDSLDGTKKSGPKKELVCQVCEQTGEDLVLCEGQCCGTYHLHCLGLSLKPQGKLLCPECSSGLHPCFCCKQTEGERRRCNVLHCGRFYHEACVRLNHLTVFDNKGFRCPLHTCLSCHYSNRAKATKGKMIRCLRCPVSYHSGEMCLAAGSEMITSNAIVCTNHFSAKKGYSHHSHVNVSWCFICSKGGRLLCCESCPSAFHPDCLNIAMPEGSWFCNDCRAGKKPKYRDIIWVKLGNYRWWPAEIRHPRSVPTNIQHLRHEIGEFPVFFFGSKDYFWTHQGRVFPYMEGDRGSKYQKTGIGKVFKKALLDAETRFKLLRMEREAKEAQKNDRKPPPYKYIKTNKPCGKVQVYTADVSEIPKCNCKPTDEKPCGFESECLNRMLMYECHPQVCPSGERCCNQDFTKRLYPDTKIVRTAGKGWGLVSLRDIKKGEFVNEYVGELIDEEECRTRIKYAQENDISHFYMLTLDKDRVIDAGPKGNYSRFMNHSCQPNTETLKWTVNGDTRVGLFAVGDIPAGTELTFNYNLDCLGNEKTVCRCGAPNCSGFLGDRPKASSGQTAEPKGKKSKRKRRSRNDVRKPSEDECFRCGDGGQLVLCDKKCCTKAYHLSCLDRTKRPFGRWDCPWHHCDVCGKNSEAFCQLCPNSFCKVHQEGALRVWTPTGQLCCLEHEELPDAETQGPVQPPPPPPPGTEAPCPLKGSRNTKTEA